MKTIIHDDFLLQSETARWLYHDMAKDLPIIDYHCHLIPALIAKDHAFTSIGEVMLAGDHYKWRVMRSFGIDEKYVTGDADYREKFRAFATALPYCAGNPMLHWTQLELKRYFDVDEMLTAESADRIYDQCEAKIAAGGFTARQLIQNSRVETLCTTDDPVDTLEHHKSIRESGYGVRVLPTFRPDKAINIHKETFLPYIREAGVNSYAGLKKWLADRAAFFHENGCRLADHGLDFIPYAEGDAAAVFEKAVNGGTLTAQEIDAYMTDLLRFCAALYAERGWCMQIHVGAIRNNNTRMYRALGPDTGFDSIADTAPAANLARLMDSLEQENRLPKTILYSLNPKDNYSLATLMGCFQSSGSRGKIQLGSGWWFNDQKDGMEEQLRALGNLGVMGTFVGMLTDSRSFVSYPRHEYFRRILCNLLGRWVEEGQYPKDEELLRNIVEGICYRNAKNYFAFE